MAVGLGPGSSAEEEKLAVAATSGDATALSGSLELDSTVAGVSALGLDDGSSWCEKWLGSGWDP